MSDTGENRGLRIGCGNAGTMSLIYCYSSPVTKKLVQMRIGRFPTVSLAEARLELQKLKNIRREGRCPASGVKEKKANEALVKKD